MFVPASDASIKFSCYFSYCKVTVSFKRNERLRGLNNAEGKSKAIQKTKIL